MDNKTLTVFTPTYNRGNLLPRLYESLCRQTNDDFKWIIIDDGSIDNTQRLIEDWKSENEIEIEYYWKENGGLHTGYNLAISKIDTNLAVCIDSDDFMPHNAVENILDLWNRKGSDNYAGIIGLDYYMGGKSVGGDLPNVESLHFIELKTKYGYRGDTKLVHRTELLKKYIPMPTFGQEKNFNPSYIFLQVDQEKPLLVLNENLCFVDYQQDGMTNNIFNQYRNSPNSFAELRRLHMTLKRVPNNYIFRSAIHYISSSIFAKDKNWFLKSPHKFYTLLAIPFGIFLNFYIRFKTRK